MVKIKVTDTQGESRDIDAESGVSLMEAIRENEFDDLQAICGGCCSCCTCHVHVEDGGYDVLPAIEEDEEYLLEDSESFVKEKSRLSCQVEVSADMEGLSVTIISE